MSTILDFDASGFERQPTELLEHAPALYVNHLQIARHLDQWALGSPDAHDQGFRQGLAHVADWLRRGYYLDGGDPREILRRSGALK